MSKLEKAFASKDMKDLAVGVLTEGLVAGNKDYIEKNVAKNYIQHNPNVPDGQSGLLAFIDNLQLPKPDFNIEPVRVLHDGNLVAIHSKYKSGGDYVVFDLFRIKDGKVVEHWDGSQKSPEKTVSGRSMIDGSMAMKDLDKTDANRTIVTNFVQDIIMDGKGDKLAQYIGDIYHQHNPNISDGREGLAKFFDDLKDNNISFSFTKIHRVVAEGNFVLTHSEGQIGGVTNAFFDLYRVEDGMLVEHWDVVQEVPAEMAHENGMF